MDHFRTSIGTKLSLFGFYTLNYADATWVPAVEEEEVVVVVAVVVGAASVSFISHQYDPMADYGRSQLTCAIAR